jgi:hypothetical protein
MSIAHSFGVSGTSGVLGSWLGASTSTANTASLLGGSTTTGNELTALLSQSSSTAPSTAQALSAGKLTNSQQRVIAAIGDNNGPLTIPWNSSGTEPTTVAAIRTAGWLKLDKKVLTNGKVTGAVYELTKVGQAIYNRTGGGSVNGSTDKPLTSTDTNGSASTASSASSTAALQSTVSSLTSILGSVGVSV